MNNTPWRPVTGRPYDPNPSNDGIEFVLTPAEKSIAAQAKCQLERHRRRQNERDAMQSLAQWKGDQHRWRV